ncbi:hypothetical protein ACP3XL_05330 [Vibrio anguillarum]
MSKKAFEKALQKENASKIEEFSFLGDDDSSEIHSAGTVLRIPKQLIILLSKYAPSFEVLKNCPKASKPKDSINQ